MNEQLNFFNNQEKIEKKKISEKKKGEIFTKPQVVKFMLMAAGLHKNLLNSSIKILEPSFGQGEFLQAVVTLLLNEIKISQKIPKISEIEDKIIAFELVESNLRIARENLSKQLERYYPSSDVKQLIKKWLRKGDFLIENVEGNFSHIVGNPPYVRVENIPKERLSEYRKRFSTMSDRADLYIPFFEKSLGLLKKKGILSFICTDRWTKNHYGRNLRALIDQNFSLDLYVDLYGQNSFQSKVMTYPAITLISNQKKGATLIMHNPTIDKDLGYQVRKMLVEPNVNIFMDNSTLRKGITHGEAPWLLGCENEVDLVQKLEREFPLMEEVGCKVYIGAATGNNQVFLIDQKVNIEESRKLPVISASELKKGWEGKSIINTYDSKGVLDLKLFPKLEAYLEKHRDALSKRHVAKKSPDHWYKTIDRVYPERACLKKLLIPDIQSNLTVVYDEGNYHPNNSLYYICSDLWDLRALKAILLSGIGRLFIQVYSTKVANGFLRFQAQHLRRIRIPKWESIEKNLQEELILAGKVEDISRCRILTSKIYHLTQQEQHMIGGKANEI